jgi:Chaperone of endosialidase
MTPCNEAPEHKLEFLPQGDVRGWARGQIANCFTLVACLLLSAASVCGQTGDALFINPQGNVGVGTTTPAATFDVAKGLFHVGGSTNPNVAAQGAYLGWNALTGAKGETDFINNQGQGSGGFAFMNTPASGNPRTTLMVITGSGNVGIGTPNPGNKLEVNGDGVLKGVVLSNGAADGGRLVWQSAGFNDWRARNLNGGLGFFPGEGAKQTVLSLSANGLVSFNDGLFLHSRSDGTASITRNAYIDEKGTWQIKDTTKKAFTLELRDSGQLELYGTPTNGKTDWRKMATFDAANNRIDFPSKAPVYIAGNLFVNGTLAYYWGPENAWKHLENRADNFAGSYPNSAPSLPSDTRLKTDLQPIPSALSKISRLRGVTFRWNAQGLRYLTRDITATLSAGPGASDEANQKLWQRERQKRYQELSTPNVGVIAQDVEAVLPEAVTTDPTGYKSVKYYELIPLLIEALKEEGGLTHAQAKSLARQQTEIQRLTAANEAAQAQLAELRDVKQKLAALETAVNRIVASGRPGEQAQLAFSSRLH